MTIKISVLISALLLSQASFADSCDELTRAGLNFGIPAGTYTVNAGDTLKVPVQASITTPDAWQPMDRVELQLSAEIPGHEGAAPMTRTVVLKDNGKIHALPTELEFQTTAAMGGDYLISSFLTGGDCGIPSAVLPGVKFTVVNAAANIELDPPVVTDVHFKASYDINKPMSFTADITDRSAICVDGLKGVSCEPTFDIYFGGEEEGLIFTKAKVSATPKPGHYAISFRKAFWRAGKYPVYGIQIQDKWGNTAGELAVPAQKVLVVTGTAK